MIDAKTALKNALLEVSVIKALRFFCHKNEG